MKKSIIIESIVVLFTILFLYTGISKIMDYASFREQIANSPILGFMAKPIAILLPGLEFLVVVLLIIPRWRLKGMYASLVLMVLFTGYIIAILCFDDHLPCSCGGIISLLSWKQHLFVNTAFIIFAIGGIVLQRKTNKEITKPLYSFGNQEDISYSINQ